MLFLILLFYVYVLRFRITAKSFVETQNTESIRETRKI